MITAGRLVTPLSAVLATFVGAVIGVVLAVLLHGRGPEALAVWPVVAGVTVAAAIGVLAARPLRRTVRRAFPSLRRAPSEIPRRVSEAVAQRLPTDELLLRVAEAVRVGLASPQVEIWVARDEPGAPAVGPEGPSVARLRRTVTLGSAHPAPPLGPDEVRTLTRAGVAGEGWVRRWLPALLAPVDEQDARRTPMRVAAATEAGQLFGLIVTRRRPGAARFDGTEDETLALVSRQLAAILRNRALTLALQASLDDVRLTNAELRASRTRVVTAGDAERRRIERDLHDGAQQHLLGLAVTVGLVKQMVDDGDPAEDVVEVLDQLGDAVRDTIGEVRSLAQGIYPALLMDGGLEPALRSAAARSPMHVELHAESVRRYPADIEAALYFCALEALQNAAKHAPGASVRVDVADRDGGLRVRIADDGPGFDAASVTSGMGRASMADRVGAYGGAVAWRSAPGAGTVVELDVPVSAESMTTRFGWGPS